MDDARRIRTKRKKNDKIAERLQIRVPADFCHLDLPRALYGEEMTKWPQVNDRHFSLTLCKKKEHS